LKGRHRKEAERAATPNNGYLSLTANTFQNTSCFK